MSPIDAVPQPAADAVARLRIALTYLWRHRRLPNLSRPRLFTELVQLRKLHDRDARLPIFADKLSAKQIVADRIGHDWVVPTLWAGDRLPDAPLWPPGFVVKSRHGCKQTMFVRTGDEDWGAIRRRAERWLATSYGVWLDEWLYGEIQRGLLVEPFIGRSGTLPIDYKFYVFGGRVDFVQVHLNREHCHRWLVLDRSWRLIEGGTPRAVPPRPSAFKAMIEAAEALGRGFDFVRVDLYQPAEQPLFGEMSFYPGSGLDPFDPPHLDALMGSLWLAERRPVGPATAGWRTIGARSGNRSA